MVCQHLRELEVAIESAGIAETYRGQPWSKNCREWVYFDCVLDMAAIRSRFELAVCVTQHVNEDPKSGRELGLFCETCHDALVEIHPKDGAGKTHFPNDCSRH